MVKPTKMPFNSPTYLHTIFSWAAYLTDNFQMYNPAIQVKKRLKSGLISTKSKPLHPGLVFLYCTLNKELHDFIRDTEGCYGFIGATRGSVWVLIIHELFVITVLDRRFDMLVGIIHIRGFSLDVW